MAVMKTWANCGMTLAELVDEYINQRKSLSKICWDRDINPGRQGLGEMSSALKRAGYEIRNAAVESAEKRKITRENMYERLGISWEELVGWYKERKPMTGLCAKHGLGGQRTVIFQRLLSDGGIIDDDPLRGFGLNKEDLLRMYVDEGMSILGIRKKFNLSRHAGTVMTSILRDEGVRARGLKGETNGESRAVYSDGYVRIAVNEENRHLTMIRTGGNEVEHRLVVAASIGRPLNRNEVVHHINWNKSDNRLSNLMLVDQDNHRKIHNSMNKVIEELFKEGRIAMNGNNEYELLESDDYRRGFKDGIESILESE